MIKFWFPILLLCSAVQAEPFDCMIAVTRQDASMDWWYAVPQEYAPKVNRISTVAKDEYFRIIPIFRNYGTDSNQNARISFDVEVLRPDGTTDISLTECQGHIGSAVTATLLPAQAILNMCFDPEDPYGEYAINVSSVDHISNQTNRQHTVVELRKFSFEKLSEKEREQLFLQYATAPNPSKAASAFMQTHHSFFDEENEPIWSAIWFFKTIFENNEYLIPHLMDEFPVATVKQKRDLMLVMTLMDRVEQLPRVSGELNVYLRLMKAGRIPDPYEEITTGKQLDMLWAEFFATGTIEPIRQIARSLSLVQYVGTLDKIKAGELDPETPEVFHDGMLEAVFQSALWSLKSNCQAVPLVYQYCEGILHSGELDAPAENCLALLLQSIATDPEKSNLTEKKE
ncbi:hypothetical protein P4C99_07000 [Pontiellaceae bacterium B1224]|nr:hypothetical protein [Pontiellaceae bacterium B1224]